MRSDHCSQNISHEQRKVNTRDYEGPAKVQRSEPVGPLGLHNLVK